MTTTNKPSYRASANLTVTNLHSLASSQSWIGGWTSGTIDNTTNLDLDILLSAMFTIASANNQPGEIRVHVYAMLDDSTWPDIFSSGTEGTEGAATVHDTEQYDSHMRMIWSTVVDTGTAEVHCMPKTGIAQFFGGVLPSKFAIFISQNASTVATAGLAASGNQVTTQGIGITNG